MSETKNQGAEQCAPDVPEPTHYNNKERLNNQVMIHAEGNAYRGRHKNTPKSCQETADDKDSGKNPAYVDADSADHLPVYCCCPGNLPYLCSIGEKPEEYCHNRTRNEEEEIVEGERKASEEGHKALKNMGHRYRFVLAAPYKFYKVAKNEGKGKGKKEEHEMLPFIQELEHAPFRNKTYKGYYEGGDDECHPETGRTAAEELCHRKSGKGPDHIEGAMGHIGNPENAEYQTQA